MKFWRLLIPFLFLFACVSGGGDSVDGETNGGTNITITLVKIFPPNATLTPLSTFSFSANGGTAPYTFALNSGSGSVSSSGTYTAPSSSGSAVVSVTDADNNIAYANITITSTMSVTPTVLTLGTSNMQTFTVTGGTPPYTYATTNGSFATASPTVNATNDYTAAAATGADTITITDSVGNTSTISVNVTNAIGFTTDATAVNLLSNPPVYATTPGTTINLSAAGGTAPIVYTDNVAGVFPTATSYTAPAVPQNLILTATDATTQTETIQLIVANAPTLSPATPKVKVGESLQFSSTTGTAPFTYAVTSGSGSFVGDTYTAPATAEAGITIEVTDANMLTDTVTLEVFQPRRVFVGDDNTCIITYDAGSSTTNTVKCFGDKNTGMIQSNADGIHYGNAASSIGDNLGVSSISTIVTTSAVYAGGADGNHSCALTSDDRLKCWGRNNYGQLGIGNTADTGDFAGEMGDSLDFVSLGTGVTVDNSIPVRHRVSVGGDHTCAVVDDGATSGQLKCWGRNDSGQLGVGNTTTYANGTGTIGDNLPYVNTGGTVIQVAAGYRHTCALLLGGTVKCWGANASGQLGLEDTTNRGDGAGNTPNLLATISLGGGFVVDEIAAGYDFTCALSTGGDIKCWGENNNGQLGQGDSTDRGGNGGDMGATLGVIPLSGTASQIEVGYDTACAINTDNSLRCWGEASVGQIGTEGTNDQGNAAGEIAGLSAIDFGAVDTVSQVNLGRDHTCALLTNNDLKCFGQGAYGAIGSGATDDLGNGAGEMGASLAAVNLGTGVNATYIAAGDRHSCALLNTGDVKCFGEMELGKLGNGQEGYGDDAAETFAAAPNSDFGTGVSMKMMTMGDAYGCGILGDDTVKCWGSGWLGRNAQDTGATLGDNPNEIGDNNVALTLPGAVNTATHIHTMYRHACLVDTLGAVYCWGEDDQGRLGNNDGVNNNIGDGAGEFTGNSAVVLSATASKVQTGESSSCALLTTGAVQCWGEAAYGVLGQGNETDSETAVTINLGTGRTAVDIAMGYRHVCVILDDNSIKCWGDNQYGQLGLEIDQNDELGDSAGEMGDNLATVDLGTGLTPASIHGGRYTSCAVFTDGRAKCWGYNDYGVLGNGVDAGWARIGDDTDEMGNNLAFLDLPSSRTIDSMDINRSTACAVMDNNEVYCWGLNDNGQLGQGHTYYIGRDPLTVGDNWKATATY